MQNLWLWNPWVRRANSSHVYGAAALCQALGWAHTCARRAGLLALVAMRRMQGDGAIPGRMSPRALGTQGTSQVKFSWGKSWDSEGR